jgi:hypothetical protein
MIANIAAARFMFPDGRSVFIECRRFHDQHALVANKEFIVTRRYTQLAGRDYVLNKSFGTPPEAIRNWEEWVRKFEDRGLQRRVLQRWGFHEEGRE